MRGRQAITASTSPARAGGRRRSLGPRAVAALVALVGLVVTGAASWTAWRLDHSNEQRLLRVQTKQAADVIGSAIVGIANPLQTALGVATATAGDPSEFSRFMSAYAGGTGVFVGASLWRLDEGTPTVIASVGAGAGQSAAAARAFVGRAARSKTFVVSGLFSGSSLRVAYALADSENPIYAVYAERAIPANRRVEVERDAAFADLRFASYLGPDIRASALATTNVAPDQLPLSGTTARESIPLGDTTVTLVTAPDGHLGGALAARLPWIFLATGLSLTALAALVAGQAVRRRRAAETDTRTIRGLYQQLDILYAQQRSVSETLQHALLPKTNPTIAGVEFASVYRAGDRGVDIGGDWYSVVPLGDGRFAFVVGDVSGRGVDAAVIMARVRFSLRAYLLEGHSPDAALAMVADDLDISRDGHLATVLVGVGDVASRTIVCANAGHLDPLIVSGGRARFVRTSVGRPLGVSNTAYELTRIPMEPDATLLAFTDGLVERRDEDIDHGLARLAGAAASAEGSLDERLASVLSTVVGTGSEDDIAALALRWTAPEREPEAVVAAEIVPAVPAP